MEGQAHVAAPCRHCGEARASFSCMKKLFGELLAVVKRVNPSMAATLRLGLGGDVVKKKLAKLPYAITRDAASLYEWADGADGPFELLPGA